MSRCGCRTSCPIMSKACRRVLPELLVTTVLDARPDHRLLFPGPTMWPLIAALATTAMFIGSIFNPWAVVWGSIPIVIALVFWFWPGREETHESVELEKRP